MLQSQTHAVAVCWHVYTCADMRCSLAVNVRVCLMRYLQLQQRCRRLRRSDRRVQLYSTVVKITNCQNRTCVLYVWHKTKAVCVCVCLCSCLWGYFQSNELTLKSQWYSALFTYHLSVCFILSLSHCLSVFLSFNLCLCLVVYKCVWKNERWWWLFMTMKQILITEKSHS